MHKSHTAVVEADGEAARMRYGFDTVWEAEVAGTSTEKLAAVRKTDYGMQPRLIQSAPYVEGQTEETVG